MRLAENKLKYVQQPLAVTHLLLPASNLLIPSQNNLLHIFVCSFPNLCVLHVTRKKAAEVLQNRILEDIKLQKKMNARSLGFVPSTTGFFCFIMLNLIYKLLYWTCLSNLFHTKDILILFPWYKMEFVHSQQS